MPRTYPPYSRSSTRRRAARDLADLRLAWHWRQEDMARYLGISVRTLRRLEHGALEPSGVLGKLVAILLKSDEPPDR